MLAFWASALRTPARLVLQVEWRLSAIPLDSMRELGRLLVVAGVVLAAVGVFLVLGGELPFRLGRLPGDIVYQGRNGSFYFPIVTCLLVSVVLTLLFWIVNLFRR